MCTRTTTLRTRRGACAVPEGDAGVLRPGEHGTAALTILQAVTEVGLLPLGPDETLQEVLERLRAGLAVESACLLLLDGAADDPHAALTVRTSTGQPLHPSGRTVPDAGSVLATVVRTGRPAVANHPGGRGACAAAPLVLGGALVGVLQVAGGDDGGLAEPDLPLLVVLADRVALAVERVRVAERELRATEALRASEQRARAVLDTAVDGIITIDGRGRVESLNPAAERLFGYASSELVGRNISTLMPEPYRSGHDAYLSRYQRTGQRRIIGIGREVVGQRRDGTTFPMELAVSEVGEGSQLYTGVVRDITERKRLEDQLAHQALHDPLTRLANRTLLLDRLEHALVRQRRHGGTVALLFLDLDRFKLVNDTLGHEAGDELLVQTAARLRAAVRPEDLVARLGGDEFVVLCEDLEEPDAAQAVARRIVATVSSPLRLRGREVFVSGSVGVVVDRGERSALELMRDADAAMYQAKGQGRGRYALGTAGDAADGDRLQLQSDLHRAVQRGELRARYQPLVDLRSGDVLAAEALLRWEHGSRGLLPPAAFLGIADDAGLSVELDGWMIATACRDAASWGRAVRRPVGVWVNLSGRSLADEQLAELVGQALDSTRLDPELLTLEITEGALMQNAAATVRTLTTLRGLGVRLAVDDFGTGYSSLAYLQQFPVHALKVDRSFVTGLDLPEDGGGNDAAIVRAVVSLAGGLELRTVAEGIETPGHLAAVQALECDLGQGFFLGRPAPAEAVPLAVAGGVVLPPGPGGEGRRPWLERTVPWLPEPDPVAG